MSVFRKRKRDYIHDAYDVCCSGIYQAAENQFEATEWWSWLAGALALFEQLKKISGWRLTPSNLDNAKLFLEVGIQPMISLWYRSLESHESHSDEEKERARSIAFRNVQTFLGISSDDSIKLYLGFDKEFQALLNNERTWCGYYIDMFYQRCLECVTGEQIVDWDKLQFPIESSGQFLEACHKSKYHDLKDPIEGPLQAYRAIMAAAKYMFEQFEKVAKKD